MNGLEQEMVPETRGDTVTQPVGTVSGGHSIRWHTQSSSDVRGMDMETGFKLRR